MIDQDVRYRPEEANMTTQTTRWPQNLYEVLVDKYLRTNLADDMVPDFTLSETFMVRVISEVLGERNAKILFERYGSNATIAEIAKEYDMTDSNVQRILSDDIRKLSMPENFNRFRIVRYSKVQEYLDRMEAYKELCAKYCPDELAHIAINKPISRFDIDTRYKNALKRNGFEDTNEVSNLTEEEVMKISGLGRKGRSAIHEALMKLGYKPSWTFSKEK